MVNFEEILSYAGRAKAAYDKPEEIRGAYPDVVRVQTLEDVDVQYFVEMNDAEQQQIISVRGTANLEDAKVDAEYIQGLDGKLDIYVHRGFDKATRSVYSDASPHLNKEYRTRLTGHSLGAAISTLLMMYLRRDGFRIEGSINFGQPKVTNKTGVQQFESLPLLRVVHADDPVPLVPPVTLLDAIHGMYEHLGAEFLLLSGPYYASLDEHDAERASVGSFWKNLGHDRIPDHYMASYIDSIMEKEKEAVLVPYTDRHKYDHKSD